MSLLERIEKAKKSAQKITEGRKDAMSVPAEKLRSAVLEKLPTEIDPELLEYKLGEISDLYINTLEKIASDEERASFLGTRYKSANYIRPGSDFFTKLIEQEEANDGESPEEIIQRMQQAQVNVAKFMRRLLVRRFESSIASFKLSLKNMINSSELMLDWYLNRGEVPIYKKGDLPDTTELEDMDPSEAEEMLKTVRKLRKDKGFRI